MAETLLGEELVEMVWERTMGTSSDTGTPSGEEIGDGLLDELLEPATVELLAALVDGEVLSNGVGSEAGVRDGVGVSAKLAGAEAPANLAAGAGAGAGDELLEPATVELLAALVDGEVLSNGVESEAGVRDGALFVLVEDLLQRPSKIKRFER